MARPELPKRWQRRNKHRKANKTSWDSGEAKRFSESDGGSSQYNPHLYGTDEAVSELEIRCVDDGILIIDGGHIKKFYMKTAFTVGVCSGEETQYVFAEWCSGEVHGRPISITALLELGVKV